jgi:restriction system protein
MFSVRGIKITAVVDLRDVGGGLTPAYACCLWDFRSEKMTKYYYEAEVRHAGLNKYRHIRGSDRYVVNAKAEAQQALWDEQWERKCAIQSERDARAQSKYEKEQAKEDGLQEAVQRTEEAAEAILSIKSILNHTLAVNDAVDWNSLKSFEEYPVSIPAKRRLKEPAKNEFPVEPLATDSKYISGVKWWDHVFPSRKEEKIRVARQRYEKDVRLWRDGCKDCLAKNEKIRAEHVRSLEKAEVDHRKEVDEWKANRDLFAQQQIEKNNAIEARRETYLSGDEGSVEDYCEMVLSNSEYPDSIPMDWEIDYSASTKIVIVNYSLPTPDNMPTLKEVKYQITKQEFKETFLSEKERASLFDGAVYQICLRTIHELFEADVAGAISCAVFNGYVTGVDKRTGHQATSCIVSLQAEKDEFLAINLSAIEPKSCFKSLKGVGASTLHSISAVPPLVNINKEDRRFIDSYDVAHGLDGGTNIALMDWADFEHLVREIFEKEFKSSGGEVRVTQASRDGGVDAVAFDPDPIRGGKIVIQAKRYANTVGVSAVRDLYGTVMNEGASKGILVTTSDFGPDAYAFVRDKPLTLLNGANLLHLLERHGHKARIDLKEAKENRVL